MYINNLEFFNEQDSDGNLLFDDEEAVNHADTLNFYESDDDDFNDIDEFENDSVV